ncbi:hypothetical protein ACJX0J_036614, partial [Zea mays]
LNERGEQSLSFIAISETGEILSGIQKNRLVIQGGILMGIDMDIYDIGSIDERDFYCMLVQFTIFKTTWASAEGLNKLSHMLREEEIKNFFKHNKAPGSDGFPAEHMIIFPELKMKIQMILIESICDEG